MVKPKVISTFAGGGGSSLGYKWAGFEELLAIEWEQNAVETLRANFNFPTWQRDICSITAEEIFSFCKINKGELDVLDGSPPCQGFSTAGKRNLNDKRNDLFQQFIRLIVDLQPKVFVMENVTGIVSVGSTTERSLRKPTITPNVIPATATVKAKGRYSHIKHLFGTNMGKQSLTGSNTFRRNL
jgi:DNA-cytosine methyltransferase